jgi:uncharacterized protein YigA (DUF484 family)
VSSDPRLIKQIEFRDAEISRLQASLRESQSKLQETLEANARHERAFDELSRLHRDLIGRAADMEDRLDTLKQEHNQALALLQVGLEKVRESEGCLDAVIARCKNPKPGAADMLADEILGMLVERQCSIAGCGKPVKGLVGATKCHEHVLEDFNRLGCE